MVEQDEDEGYYGQLHVQNDQTGQPQATDSTTGVILVLNLFDWLQPEFSTD